MAKKTKKGKPAKKAVKPAKKVVVKKPLVVKKKAVAKKIVKPIKKVIAKKSVKSAKKVVAKKIVKSAKKTIAKKVVKPAKKIALKKAVKAIKKVVVKKVISKKIAKPVKKVIEKAEKKKTPLKAQAVQATKPIKKQVAKLPPVTKTSEKPLAIKKSKNDDFLDDDGGMLRDEPMVIEYKTPALARPIGPTPIPHINTDTRTRYSDEELKEFKTLILKKLVEAQKDFELLKSTLSHKDDHGTDDTSPTFKLLEDGSDVLSKEETSHLANRQEKFIQNLQNALIRVENKTYGICRISGKLISKERLKSVPHATLAIEAKLGQNN